MSDKTKTRVCRGFGRHQIAGKTGILAKGLYFACAVLWVFAAINVIAEPAFAYVDPGSGLFLLQIIGSTTVGFTFLIRKRIRQVFGLLTKGSKQVD